MLFVAILAVILRTLLVWENKRLAEKYEDDAVANDAHDDGVENYGPKFRYVL